ncbi:hypothetical protein POV27_17450 [Aureisphaera galaxeae]|uniref:hypothetical protein n=1 Tax=Aureisphaera galaxeae TaxID=1538023 RepID=UPI0023506A13|nr:hypothetical protein [Aureisphaera galaxeae]MDC8005843.1 hypothetical protein [Aureisphaera galaxeae]
MKSQFKSLLFTTLLGTFLLFGTSALAQKQCCGGENHDEAKCAAHHAGGDKAKVECTTAVAGKELTSGCAPSACRGAKTKYGEAKVITQLRTELVALKADMEKSKNPSFDAKSYDIHGIVGKTDDESLEILIKEIQKVEKAFSERTAYSAPKLSLPENKAKKVQYLMQRVQDLMGHL